MVGWLRDGLDDFRDRTDRARSLFREQEEQETPGVRSMTALEQAVMKVLADYPEAYEAVLTEVRKRCGPAEESP